jgi:hypothetical protein
LTGFEGSRGNAQGDFERECKSGAARRKVSTVQSFGCTIFGAAVWRWPGNSLKFVDDFEAVLLIPKALTAIFRLKNFYFGA